MSVDRDYEQLEQWYALPWRREENPPGAALVALVLLAFALIGLQDGKRVQHTQHQPRRWDVAKKDEAVTRREFFAGFAVVALAPLSLSPDFGWCRCCETYHDLDIPCRPWLEEQGVIFTDNFNTGGY